MREVVYHSHVVNHDIPALDATIRIRIKTAIEDKLMTSPEIFGVPLRQSLQGYRKLRVGDYRVVFSLSQKRISILAILHRSQVYQKVLSRIVK